VHLDLKQSLQKLKTIVSEASSQKIDLLVFGETWLSGYPSWLDHCPNVALWDDPGMKDVFQRMHANGLAIDSKAFEHLTEIAKKANMVISIGVNEVVRSGPGNGTIYNSLLLINENGKLVNHRRKLMPTFTEKMVYGIGDGKDLEAANTKAGRIGGMICWEHWMPLTRQALHNSGEDIHIAVWPTVFERHQLASRHYAFEGRCFVVAAGQILKASDFPKELTLPDHLKENPDTLTLKGGSCIIGPDGNYIVEPVFDKEALVIGEVDIASHMRERMTLDVSGHYQRDDVFKFEVKGERK
jgi:predicted amidohydrolase